MTELNYIIILPILAGIVLFLFPERLKMLKGLIALAIAGVAGYFSIKLYGFEPQSLKFDCFAAMFSEGSVVQHVLTGASKYFYIHIDGLSKLITLGIGFFAFVILIYSLTGFSKQKQIKSFY